ncbi:ThuA domain-containing protein [Pirellulaceae bacterium SH449]
MTQNNHGVAEKNIRYLLFNAPQGRFLRKRYRTLFSPIGLVTVLLAGFAAIATAGDEGSSKSTEASPDSSLQKTHVLVVAGPSEHPPGTHEVAATGRLIKHLLEESKRIVPTAVTVVSQWPADRELLDAVTSVVFLGDFFPPTRMENKSQIVQQLDELTQRGCGIVCVHFATGLAKHDVTPEGHHPLLDWTGGYFATACEHHQSVATIFESTIEPAERAHAVLAGWKSFRIHDEPYYEMYFGPKETHERLIPFATAMIPPEAPRQQLVAWGIERPDGGRGAAIVLPHYFRNWLDPNMRTLILNLIVWSARIEVPSEGVDSQLDDLQSIQTGTGK